MRSWKPGRRLGLKARRRATEIREALRVRLAERRPVLALSGLERRLELTVTALYGVPLAIAPTSRGTPSWPRRAWAFVSRRADVGRGTPASDGGTIQLPPELPAHDGHAAALARYRLFTIEQAERIVRGTPALMPVDPLARDLYLVREAAVIDARIARLNPGMRETLARERAAALAGRPRLASLTATEREVELMLRQTLSATPGDAAHQGADAPAASLAWAEASAARIRSIGAQYRGIPPAQVWGTVKPLAISPSAVEPPSDWRREESRPIEHIIARKYSGGQTQADSEASSGQSDTRSDKYTERGQGSSGRAEDARPGAGAPDRHALKDEHAPPREVAAPSGAPATNPPASLDDPELAHLPPATAYDEWDAEAGRYVKRGALVRLDEAPAGDPEWATDVLQRHASVVRQIRHQFEQLRARRVLLARQRAGDDLDITACVDAIVDRRIGQLPDDRLYLDARPARRGLAIALLADISGSTKAKVSDEWRIIDLEKIALVLASEALDALGDLFAIYAFAGKGSTDVRLTTVKEFSDPGGALIRRRIAAIEPSGFTRMGAAVRHATHRLARQPAGHRLLLLLSDGRPNDIDRYQGTYGIEDSRQAILDARASGVYPFCLTVDAAASQYLPRIFGHAGHTVLQRPGQLPTALVRVVRGLIRRR